jgi:hypothetical protein
MKKIMAFTAVASALGACGGDGPGRGRCEEVVLEDTVQIFASTSRDSFVMISRDTLPKPYSRCVTFIARDTLPRPK